MVTIGETALPRARHALVTGMPHPNEPTGTLGALALAELLATQEALLRELGLVWHIVPCVDPDGAALNREWYAGPFTRRHYAEHIYRPPFAEQYEWTFNRPDREPPGLPGIPESAAVAALIDRTRPELLVSMHNGEAGGLFALVTTKLAGLEEGLQGVSTATGLPLYQGVPEEEAPVLGPGLFLMEDGGDMVSSTGYAAQYGTVGVVSEPPMWLDPRTADESLSTSTHGEVHTSTSAARDDLEARMGRWVERTRTELPLTGARGRAVVEQLRSLARPSDETQPDPELIDQPCTVALVTSMAEDVTMERLRCAGHLLAYLREESERQPLSAALRAVRAELTDALDAWAAGEHSLEFVGLGRAVRGHVGMALTAASLLR